MVSSTMGCESPGRTERGPAGMHDGDNVGAVRAVRHYRWALNQEGNGYATTVATMTAWAGRVRRIK